MPALAALPAGFNLLHTASCAALTAARSKTGRWAGGKPGNRPASCKRSPPRGRFLEGGPKKNEVLQSHGAALIRAGRTLCRALFAVVIFELLTFSGTFFTDRCAKFADVFGEL